MISSSRRFMLFFGLAFAIGTTVFAQETEQQRIERILSTLDLNTIQIPRIDQAVNIDGELTDASWSDAVQIDIAWQHQPVGGVEARYRTTALAMENGEYLYVGFKSYDPRPEEVRAFLGDRDKLFRDDYVGFGIDTTGDGARAFEFFSNPLGVQGDAIVDVQEGEDFSFDVIFETAGQVTSTGYEVEFAVPISQIRFPTKAGLQQWKMFFTRAIPRDKRYQNFNYPIDRSNSCMICQYQATEGFENAKAGKRFQVVPTFTANSQETTDLDVADSTDRDSETQFGIDDFRWGITPDISLNATVNPDFSQIEADTAQLSVNTNFALFYPERRPFFLEGRDLFNTPIKIVNTRNISDPDYGAKLSGKSGSNVYGLLSSRDSVTNIILPGSQSSSLQSLDQDYSANLLRYRHDLADSSYVGVLVAERDGDDYSNEVVSFDALYRFNNKDRIEVQYIDTKTENPDELVNDPDIAVEKDMSDAAYGISYMHNSTNASWKLVREVFGKGFRADSGFITQTDIKQTKGDLNYHWRGSADGFVTAANTGYFGTYKKLDSTGDFLSKENGFFLNGTFPGQTFVGFNRRYGAEVFEDVRFETTKNELNIRSRPASGLSFFTQFRYDDQVDYANTRLGKQFRFFQEFDYNITRHLLLGLDFTHAKLKIDGDELFTANLVDLRLSYQFTLKSKLRLVLINSDIKRDPTLYVDSVDRRSKSQDIQLLYSYKANPRTVFFAGFSTSGRDDDDLPGLTSTNETAFIKWTYAWRL